MVLMNPFVFSVLYVWCKNEPDRQVSLWGIPVSSGNLPWALLVFSVLTGGSPFNDLIGIAAGHTYIFLKMTLPVTHGYDLLKTPKFFENFINGLVRRAFGNTRVRNLAGERVNPNENPMPGNFGGAAFRAFGGRGMRLGGQ